MKTQLIGLTLSLTLLSLLASAGEKTTSQSTTNTNAPAVQVIAYYLHGTVRCETCQKIERQAREVIGAQFKSELAAKQLVFKPVNYDLPENAHFQQDYQLPCPSLVIVRQREGKDEKWKLLGETWTLVEDAPKFNTYVSNEVAKLLPARK